MCIRDSSLIYLCSFAFSVRSFGKQHNVAENIVGNHDEVLEALTKEQAEEESKRCMSCGLCFDCNQCAAFCPQEAISRYRSNPVVEVMYTHYTKCVGCDLLVNRPRLLRKLLLPCLSLHSSVRYGGVPDSTAAGPARS